MEITKAVAGMLYGKSKCTVDGSDRSSPFGSRYVWALSLASAPERCHVIISSTVTSVLQGHSVGICSFVYFFENLAIQYIDSLYANSVTRFILGNCLTLRSTSYHVSGKGYSSADYCIGLT